MHLLSPTFASHSLLLALDASGDAVIGLVVEENLFMKYPDLEAYALTQLRCVEPIIYPS